MASKGKPRGDTLGVADRVGSTDVALLEVVGDRIGSN